MLREKTYYLDVRRRPSHSATFATLPASLRGSMAYLSSVENRKNLLFIVNFALLVCSLILIGERLLRLEVIFSLFQAREPVSWASIGSTCWK